MFLTQILIINFLISLVGDFVLDVQVEGDGEDGFVGEEGDWGGVQAEDVLLAADWGGLDYGAVAAGGLQQGVYLRTDFWVY